MSIPGLSSFFVFLGNYLGQLGFGFMLYFATLLLPMVTSIFNLLLYLYSILKSLGSTLRFYIMLLCFREGEVIKFLRLKWSRWTCNRPKFRRRALPYHLVMRCRRRIGNRPWHVWRSYINRCCKTPSTTRKTWSELNNSVYTTCPKDISDDKWLNRFCRRSDFLSLYR